MGGTQRVVSDSSLYVSATKWGEGKGPVRVVKILDGQYESYYLWERAGPDGLQ